MTRMEKIRSLFVECKPELARRFKVKEIALFGSYVRGENTAGSDLDVLVDFSAPIGLFAFLELEEYLRKRAGVRRVDLVSKKALKPIIGKAIIREAVRL